jgi:hypothetical protein
MTGTCAACLHTNQSWSYLNHLVFLCFPQSYVYHYMLHSICHLHPYRPTVLLLCPSPFTLLLLHFKFMHVQQMCQNLDRLKSSTLNISGIWQWKIYHITTSHMMQPLVHDWKTELHSSGKQVPSRLASCITFRMAQQYIFLHIHIKRSETWPATILNSATSQSTTHSAYDHIYDC